ncbi:MAG: penicillin-binding protein 2 [Epsilonproteobacteria bacterium]|nr:MAG: penicillin-binding protein 2 [Campylobacterota bacterium]
MQETKKDETHMEIAKKLNILYGMFVFLVLAFLFSVFRTILSDRHIPAKTAVIHDRSLRGDIISKDGYTLSSSYKLYQATVYAKCVDPKKKELFIKLFSIYSGIDEETLKKKFYDKKGKKKTGRVTLSYNLNARKAIQLKSLAYKLRQLKVFRSIKNHNGVEVLYGLDIVESGEARRFPLKDCLTPIIGYVRKNSDDRYTRPVGQKGLERYAEEYLTTQKNGLLTGGRDVVGAVIRNGSSRSIQRVDGLDLHLNIPLDVQRRVEMVLDEMKAYTGAEEIIAAVMESKTGKVLAMASSERYDPINIKQEDVSALNPKFAEHPYEVGSVMKPLTLSIALDLKRVTPNTWFETFNGRMKISKRRTVTDDDKFARLTATDIIVHSSNVGISQISWRVTGREFREGLLKFGLAQPSGIDLTRDLPGRIKPIVKLQNKMHRANQSYGYGMHATFAQMLKAYSAFNNDGKAMTPRIIDYFEDKDGKHYKLPPPHPDREAISKKTSKQIHEILREVVKRGTGVAGQYKGLEIGGKTGTAHIATSRGYTREYHSSFFGFANDNDGHKYTIGVLVIKVKKRPQYFASQSAVPTFKKITNILVELHYLRPELNLEELAEEQEIYAAKERKKSAKNSVRKARKTVQRKKRKASKTRRSSKSSRSVKAKPKRKRKRKARSVRKSKPPHEFFNDLDMF